ncbi:hypothetical protein BOX15_Mlig015354g1 [Macrostomum lignano]|uniref:Tyrosine-protein kinase n=1 Tax=Macrostomum lignano TaxID=282301 RepID=A0A267FFU1_9PLAT|nr:hypothetical protein BOX15_Mlig020998g3 [Macrostomum lignano]PAA72583.1 hypothetical protein BOX15_Mlig015354g1 [Macrostomum lignano]
MHPAMTASQTAPRQISVGQTVFVLFDYAGKCAEDLPIKEGEDLTVVECLDDPNWIVAENSRHQKGLVPENYIALGDSEDLSAYPWFHGSISRAETDKRLVPRNINGLFLVRLSSNHPGDLTLSVVFSNQVSHYHVKKVTFNSARFYYTIDEESRFYPLDLLVQHYRNDADGLCCELVKGVDVSQVNLHHQPQHPHQQRHFQASNGDLQIHEVIGRGEFSEVRRGTYRNEQVAVKCMISGGAAAAAASTAAPELAGSNAANNNSKPPTEAEIAALSEEAELMRKLNHTNLVRFIELLWQDGQPMLVTELLSKGSLLNYLRSRGQTVIMPENQIQFALDIAAGMAYLAGKQLVHRDLAARNILLDDDCRAKVADFGLAKSFRDSKQHSNGGSGGAAPGAQERIPLKWTAPECVKDHAKFSTKSDVWSFAVLLWEIYTFGRMPYPRIKTDQVLKHVLNGYRMEMPERCPSDVYKLMRRCWELTPEQRPNFDEIVQQLKTIEAN